jgi:biopolymer transport protein ExbD
MRRKKGLLKKRRALPEDMALQITAMADIFTVILVFLLKSVSTGISNVTPAAELKLPEVAKTEDEMVETLKVEILADGILIDDKPVTRMVDFKFDGNDIESNGTPRSLNVALIKERENEKSRKPSSEEEAAAEKPGAEQKKPHLPRLMILADQRTPYSTLKTVLASATITGFADFKLVVVEDK